MPDVAEEGENFRIKADAALAENDWRRAAELYSKAFEAAVGQLKGSGFGGAGGASWHALRPLYLALSGRSRAFVQLGKGCGSVKASPEILQVAVKDATQALNLARSGGHAADIARAVAGLSDVLTEAGRPEEARACVAEALAAAPDSEELRALSSSTAQSELAAKMDEEIDDGRSPGTFRWPRETALPKLPPRPQAGLPASAVSDKGWEPYLRARGGESLIASAHTSAPLLDGLSFPLSLAWALAPGRAARWPAKGSAGQLHVLVLGATARAEVRLWAETAYWQELEHMFADRCKIHLEFLGPEVDPLPAHPGRVHQMAAPGLKRFFSGRPELTPANTVCSIFNGGFGNLVASGRDDLLWSWLPDLAFLAERGFLCTFFCANDYADLKGEVSVHAALLGSRFVLAPRRNPFAMATVYTGQPGGEEAKEWFCGNSFVYATCGCEKVDGACGAAAAGDAAARRRMLSKVLQKARAVGDNSLEVCSGEVPLLKPSPLPTASAAAKEGSGDLGDAADPAAKAKGAASKAAGRCADVAAGVAVVGTQAAGRAAGGVAANSAAEAKSPASAEDGRRAEADAGAPGGSAGAAGRAGGAEGGSAANGAGGRGADSAAAAGAGSAATDGCGSADGSGPPGGSVHGGRDPAGPRPETTVKFEEREGCRWLRYEVLLPGLDSIEQADLQISDTHISLAGAAGFAGLREPWPEDVDSGRAGASFSSRKGRLVIRAPVRA